jgi:hypothetical protein
LHAPTEDKSDDMKNYRVHWIKFRSTKLILFGGFSAEVGKEDISKQEIGKESLYQIMVTVVNVACQCS